MARLNGHNALTVVRTAYLNVAEAYPVGSIYMSVNSTSPAALFGGTWERISDKFLYGAANDNEIGDTGGEATHQLTINEMPSHNHDILYNGETRNTYYQTKGNWDGSARYLNSEFYQANEPVTISNKGGGQAHNNMPPYVKVAIWKRTA